MSIGSFFTHKMGPLPVWGWGAIAAGGTFLLLKGGGGSASKKGAPGGSANSAGNGSSGTFTGNSTTTETLSSDQTFGGGTLGFIGRPLFGDRPVFANLFQSDGGGLWHGGRRYDDRPFWPFGFGSNGQHRGGYPGTDHRHGAFGGRNFRGGNNSGHPRGFGQGHYTPGAGIGARIAKSFHPSSPSARYTSPIARHTNRDALPTVGYS
jgi:hypothetical protein